MRSPSPFPLRWASQPDRCERPHLWLPRTQLHMPKRRCHYSTRPNTARRCHWEALNHHCSVVNAAGYHRFTFSIPFKVFYSSVNKGIRIWLLKETLKNGDSICFVSACLYCLCQTTWAQALERVWLTSKTIFGSVMDMSIHNKSICASAPYLSFHPS